VRLVDDKEAHARSRGKEELPHELVVAKPLGRDEERIDLSPADALERRRPHLLVL